MTQRVFRVAIVGGGRMGQEYARAYTAYPDTRIVGLVEPNEERRRIVGQRFRVAGLYATVQDLLHDQVPDIVSVVAPTKYLKDAVLACAAAGVPGIQVEKPMAALLSDADEMVDACARRGLVLSGGNLQRAMPEVQEAARRLRAGEYGPLLGATMHGWGGEISGGGCQHVSVLRLLTDAEVTQVVAWGSPPEALQQDHDGGLVINGQFRLSNGLLCSVFGAPTPQRGVDVWTADALVRWDWDPPEIYRGFGPGGQRLRTEPQYAPYEWSEFGYLTGSIRALLAAVETGSQPWITGHDLRQALEVAIAARRSAQLGQVPVSLPLADRSLCLYPVPYRWVGGDATGQPQSAQEAAGGRPAEG